MHSAFITEHLVIGAPPTVARGTEGGLGALTTVVRAEATTQATADAFGWSAVALMLAFCVVLALRPTPIPFPPGK